LRHVSRPDDAIRTLRREEGNAHPADLIGALLRLGYPAYMKAKPAKPMHTPAKSAIM
jgi:hypothetical protein